MAQNITCCDMKDELKEKIKKFRYRKEKTIAACVLKIDFKNKEILPDEDFEDISIEELQESLPEFQPRYIILSYVYKHDDGRVSYPLCFIYYCPRGLKPEMSMMAAGSKLSVQTELGLTKVMEIQNIEDLTEEWLIGKLQFFR